ncbi:MAG: hypothetical protein WBG90_03185 [Saonia sp.]
MKTEALKSKKYIPYIMLLFIVGFQGSITAQVASNVYYFEEDNNGKTRKHELKINNNYVVHTVYEKSPAKFIKTQGGFVEIHGKRLKVLLEFNSNYEQDSLRKLSIPFEMEHKNLILNWETKMIFKPEKNQSQDLDGQWLFATRGPDEGQERRGEENPRKTLKFLMNGRFQWIAYNTESLKFFGTGGGSFIAKDGIYTENIEFFSRDDSRVGASLQFDYEVKENDWHHTGKNSKGEPMYEIWAKRGL